ncbi:NAD(P)-dependent alcohol dehydrogenase [Winogradskya humida]|uniref:NAD(P)-dependent alcohol dehydrogenase n=1 Tax=Winogradskya humida TaxID=113566 RepID=UPI0019456AED|nr:NAD(P)-dependent alcohol dehydrogenase [Actinoplanes humidus]
MRAMMQDRYGFPGTLRLREVGRPAVGDGDVLVRVRAACVHPDVWHVVSGRPYVLRVMGSGVRRPKDRIPGTDFAGVVAELGRGVTDLAVGDEVFGESLRGFSWRNGGAFAEYASVARDSLARKPAGVTFEQAATVPTTGYITLVNVPAERLRPGARVLVNGAGGGVGAIAVQLAKASGAHVTAVDQGRKSGLLRGLGADRVVDYAIDDFTQGTYRYDLIVDVPGNHPFAAIRRVLAPDGLYVLIGHDDFGRAGHRWLGSLPRFGRLAVQSLRNRQLPRPTRAGLGKKEAMGVLRDLLESGRLTPVVDRAFPLAEAEAAMGYLISGEPVGRVVLTV